LEIDDVAFEVSELFVLLAHADALEVTDVDVDVAVVLVVVLVVKIPQLPSEHIPSAPSTAHGEPSGRAGPTKHSCKWQTDA
jgi:hypothetical protein